MKSIYQHYNRPVKSCCEKKLIGLIVIAIVGVIMMSNMTQAGELHQWERVKRTIVAESEWRARYPSITRANDGSLLVLFTQQTQEQEDAGSGDLIVARSTDKGDSWSDAVVVFQGGQSEPRAVHRTGGWDRGAAGIWLPQRRRQSYAPGQYGSVPLERRG